MNFPTVRHYFSSGTQPQDYNKIVTDFGEYNIYDVDRSVCDCIRFRKEMDEDIFGLILDSYRACRERQNNRILEYARRLNMANEMLKYICLIIWYKKDHLEVHHEMKRRE